MPDSKSLEKIESLPTDTRLTRDELVALSNMVANSSVLVKDAPIIIALCNKLQKMVDEISPSK